jgi:hypothetical protein
MKALFFGTKADWSETFFWKDRPNIVAGTEFRLFDILIHKSSVLEKIIKNGGIRQSYKIPKHIPVILSTIMPDPYLDRLFPGEDNNKYEISVCGKPCYNYIALAKIVNPDLITSIEIPLYDGDNGQIVDFFNKFYRSQLLTLRNYFPVERIIVLVPGRTKEEVQRNVIIAYRLGYRRFGLACADPMQRNARHCRSQIRNDLNIIKKYAKETYLFGITSPRYIEEFSDADFIVTRGWYHTAMKFKQVLTYSGSEKAAVPPILQSGQQSFSQSGILTNISTEKSMKIRSTMVKFNALKNIDVLLSKLQTIQRQKTLEVYAPWPVKAEAVSEQVIAPQHTVVLEASAEIRV